MKKIHPFLWGLIVLAALALVGVVTYFIGFLDFFLVFILMPGILLATIVTFIVSLVSVLRLKKEDCPVPDGKKIALAVSAILLASVLVFITVLVVVFAMAIAYM